MKSERSPILVGTHTRLEHLKRTVLALQNNTLADQTEIYFASDGARNSQEEEIVSKVREYIDSVDGFKTIHKIYRSKNFGHFNNFQNATDIVFQAHDSIIKLEDDIETSSFFLEYMNDALDLYRHDSRVISVSGHIYNGLKFNTPSDTALLAASNGWGWGTWKNKFYLINHDPKIAQRFLSNPILFAKMMMTNPSLVSMVRAVANESLLAGDVNWALHNILHNTYVLFPKFSLVRNIGFDGSGQNCGIDLAFELQPISADRLFVSPISNIAIKKNSRLIFQYFGGWKECIKQSLLHLILIIHGEAGVKFAISIKKFLVRLNQGNPRKPI